CSTILEPYQRINLKNMEAGLPAGPDIVAFIAPKRRGALTNTAAGENAPVAVDNADSTSMITF
ncbi:hypothetical protein BGZ94_005579, partial [Podila epigama]